MFEKFTDRARRVIVLAQDEARMLNHGFIGTEHLLLGICREGEGLAAQALEALGTSLEAVREQVEEIIGHGERQPSGHIPFTPRAKKVLELSLREAFQLGHEDIGSEHILLGLVREGDGVAAQVLVRLGLDLDQVRQKVIELAGGPRGEAASATPVTAAGRRGPIVFRREREVTGRLVGQVSAIEARLEAVERRVGTGPEDLQPSLADLADRLRALTAEVERLRRLIEPPGTGSNAGQ